MNRNTECLAFPAASLLICSPMASADSEQAVRPFGFPPLVEHALRLAASYHSPQARKGGAVPYITHPVGVALLLQRFGFDDDALIAAALLHDVVEDTPCTLDQLASRFPPEVVEAVAALSERKQDEHGSPRPWRDRKQEHIRQMGAAPWRARAVLLADKLHNLSSMQFDLDAGEAIWSRFHASRAEVLWYHRTIIVAACQDDPRLTPLADACHTLIDELTPPASGDC